MPQDKEKQKVIYKGGKAVGYGRKKAPKATFGYVPKGKEGDSRYTQPMGSSTKGKGMDPRNIDPMPLNDAHVKTWREAGGK